MNYRHIYHAGNFADIVKHLVLIALIEQLKKKEKPFAVLDGFAGVGIYDLNLEAAQKTSESLTGIKKLLSFTKSVTDLPNILQIFLNLVKTFRQDYYPGSPLIITKLLRPNDRLIACELHPADYLSLKSLLSNTYEMDAYTAIKAFLPFKEKRGLIFLDPPFEVKNEFDRLFEAIKEIKSRALNNCVLIWYPIKDRILIRDFYHKYKNIGFKETLIIEYELLHSDKNMIKCGLMIINPPNIKDDIMQISGYLTMALNLKVTSNYL
ncbi:23S rRNA (adenine(2030)-N(6))-methyltransferase RlmJ [Rickettsia endosymbiont of Halotydeus destructor]|uniref:23S rRNA (adenine(2030)-N(6))-methyltransferase RlmJ n=1 Tax=Rickettsia endosymbiont of Halotydeus destructor TaxID=2996754 RepID=UPI003BB0AD74